MGECQLKRNIEARECTVTRTSNGMGDRRFEAIKTIVKLISRTDNSGDNTRPQRKHSMKRIPALILTGVLASFAVCALASPQSSTKRRTPALTNDDLEVASASASLPSEAEVRLSIKERATLTEAIAWQRDLRRAGEIARAEGKLVVADVYTDWCGWCHKMDETIYSDPAIVALSRQQVFVKVNAEDRGEGQRFAQEMGVRGYPTTVFLDGQGKVLNMARGYISSPRAFGKLVQEALAQAR